MATGIKPCQAEDNEKCKNEARAYCYHCCRDLCLDHLTQHAQLIDALTRSTLEDYFIILTNLSTHLQSLTISTKILNEPFLKIEQWRIDAYHQIDNIVEKKFQEIRIKIEEYRQIFDTIRNEQLDKVIRYKQKIAELFRKTQVTNKDMSNLNKSIEQIQNDSNIFNKHSIEVLLNRPLIHSINIQMQLNDWKPPSPLSSSSSLSSSTVSSIIHQLEFHLKYVRLSGIVTCHYVLVEVNGTIGDLIDQFIMTENKLIIDKCKRDYFLATEINQYRVRRRFTNDIQLKTIFNKIDELILYETPFELNTYNLQQYCLILCQLQDGLPWNIKFGLPILLNVPRFQCQGRDVINALDKILNICFPLMINNNIHYEVRIVSDNYQITTATILNQWADEVIDDHLLMADNAILVVNLINNSQLSTQKQITDLARLDGTLKNNNDKWKKNRK
ncbi:unnamed protein product [Rotaria sordida]|uniref:Uncharacterized protein n=1 Tax=Rotaria sordida TaxID=392033 RepID=A0A818Q297_9BILA|nr:unnamed protein product [Rotaria sordida]